MQVISRFRMTTRRQMRMRKRTESNERDFQCLTSPSLVKLTFLDLREPPAVTFPLLNLPKRLKYVRLYVWYVLRKKSTWSSPINAPYKLQNRKVPLFLLYSAQKTFSTVTHVYPFMQLTVSL